MSGTFFQKDPPNFAFSEKKAGPWCKQFFLAQPDDFSSYEYCLKRIVYTLMADFLYGDEI
jgi:hypothetical protein